MLLDVNNKKVERQKYYHHDYCFKYSNVSVADLHGWWLLKVWKLRDGEENATTAWRWITVLPAGTGKTVLPVFHLICE